MSKYSGFRFKVQKNKISLIKTVTGKLKDGLLCKDYTELRISRIFHKALNRYRLTGIFEKNDYEILGTKLYKILVDDANISNFLTTEFADIINDKEKRCRVYLEFEDADDVAVLPWEYLYIEGSGNKPPFYLAADRRKKFDLIRSVGDEKNNYTPQAGRPLNIILYIANTETKGQRTVDANKLAECFDKLADDFRKQNVTINPVYLAGDRQPEKFANSLKQTIATFDNEPYVFHFFGHAMMDDKDGKPSIGFINEADGKNIWINDKVFADFFDTELHPYKMPEMIFLQACESGQVNEDSRGIGIQLALKKIPAVVAMQNEITEDDSIAFVQNFYSHILRGCDVGEAITYSRTFLGCEYDKNKTGDINHEGYTSNIFGTPVLFISTEEPVQLMPELIKAAGEEKIIKYCPACKKEYTNPEFYRCPRIECRGKDNELKIMERDALKAKSAIANIASATSVASAASVQTDTISLISQPAKDKTPL